MLRPSGSSPKNQALDDIIDFINTDIQKTEEVNQKARQMREMFPQIPSDVIREHATNYELFDGVQRLMEMADKYTTPHRKWPTGRQPMGSGSSVELIEEHDSAKRPCLPSNNSISTKETETSKPSTSRAQEIDQNYARNQPLLLELPKGLDLKAWNDDQVAENLWVELIRRNKFVDRVKPTRSVGSVHEMKMFLRDHFAQIRMPVIHTLVEIRDFYQCMLILKLAILGWEQRLVESKDKFLPKTLTPVLCSADHIASRSGEAGLNTVKKIPALCEQMWKNFQEIINYDYTKQLLELTRFDCPVCYDTYDNSDAIICTSCDANNDFKGYGHTFCAQCVRQHAIALSTEMSIGPGGVGVKCLEHGCDGIIKAAHVIPHLNAKEQILFTKRQDEEALRSAHLENVESCQQCCYAVEILSTKEEQPIFVCENPNCRHQHCRLCEKPYNDLHRGRKCDDILSVHDVERKKKEEELTLLMIRKCTNCSLSFQRKDGCNKMTCPKCGTTQCYLCRQSNIGYDHFGGVGKCPSQTSDQEVFKRDEKMRKEAIAREASNQLLKDADRLGLL